VSTRITVSASQIENYRLCNRKWWFRSIKKISEPQTEAQLLGDRFAKAIEAQLKGWQIPRFDELSDATIDKFLDAASSYFPDHSSPTAPQIFAERKIEFQVPDLPARMVGYIDVLEISDGTAHIRDHKTKSNKKYALAHDTLADDTQLNIYAYAIRLDLPEAQLVGSTLGHINYIKPDKAKATDLDYIRDVWKPEVFLRQIPLDAERNDRIMGVLKNDIEGMLSLNDSLLDPHQVPFDQTGRACFSYGQPCAYSAICPKMSLRPSIMTLKSGPPQSPLKQSAPLAPSAPPAPPLRSGPPAPPPRSAPPAPAAVVAAPATSVGISLRPAPPAKFSVPEVDEPLPVISMGVNPPSMEEILAFPPVPSDREPMPVVAIDRIPNLGAKAKNWLVSHEFSNSLQIAHITEAYLSSLRASKAVLTDVMKVVEIMRHLHMVDDPDPFSVCPTPLGQAETVSSHRDMMTDLPAHKDAPSLLATPPIMPNLPPPRPPASAPSAAVAPPAPPARSTPTAPPAPSAPPRPAAPAAPAAPSTPAAPTVHASAPTPTAAPFTLYLECSPIKGANFVILEDWLEPILKEIERVSGVPTWRSIIEFGRFNELLHNAVWNILEGNSDIAPLPSHLVVLSSYTEYAKATLDLLIRRADIVVKK
jgi:hypothetical protein